MNRLSSLFKAFWIAYKIDAKYVIISGIRVPIPRKWLIKIFLIEIYRLIRWLLMRYWDGM